MKRISDEKIRVLIDKAEEEYADVDMTDAEWEMKRWTIIAQAQLDSCEKEMKELFEKIESPELAPDTDDDRTVRIIILSYAKVQALKQKVLG